MKIFLLILPKQAGLHSSREISLCKMNPSSPRPKKLMMKIMILNGVIIQAAFATISPIRSILG
jgi:hypothetical protein